MGLSSSGNTSLKTPLLSQLGEHFEEQIATQWGYLLDTVFILPENCTQAPVTAEVYPKVNWGKVIALVVGRRIGPVYADNICAHLLDLAAISRRHISALAGPPVYPYRLYGVLAQGVNWGSRLGLDLRNRGRSPGRALDLNEHAIGRNNTTENDEDKTNGLPSLVRLNFLRCIRADSDLNPNPS